MTSAAQKYYSQVSKGSNRELVTLFRENIQLRYDCEDSGWKNKNLVKKLTQTEKIALPKVLRMLKKGDVKTRDDFFRAAHFFQHSLKFQDYAMAATLYMVSAFLGDTWGKNYHALAIDRFLLSIKQKQYFGTQYEKKNGKWSLSPYRKGVKNEIKKLYFVPPIKEAIKMAKNFK